MPKVEDICWCTNGILFAYHDLLYSIGDGPNGCDAIRMSIGPMQDRGI